MTIQDIHQRFDEAFWKLRVPRNTKQAKDIIDFFAAQYGELFKEILGERKGIAELKIPEFIKIGGELYKVTYKEGYNSHLELCKQKAREAGIDI